MKITQLTAAATILGCLAAGQGAAAATLLTGFETPRLTQSTNPSGFNTTFIFDPRTVPGVTFANSAGIQQNGSGWKLPAAPQGIQTAFLQTDNNGVGAAGSLTVNASTLGFPLVSGDKYQLSWEVAGRASTGSEPYTVSYDGTVFAGVLQNPALGTWVDQSHVFQADGAQTFTWNITNANVRQSIGLDNIQIEQVPDSTPIAPVYATGAPEPAAWALMLVGVFGVGGSLRAARRRQAPATAA